MPDSVNCLELISLACQRNQRALFSNIDLRVYPGELILISGKNGSGKTSLLKIICGLLKPSAGKVFYQGQDIHKDLASFYANLLYIGHQPTLKIGLTVQENLAYLANLHGLELNTSKLRQLIDAVGLNQHADEVVEHLSAGQQRRLNLSRLLYTQADVWVLDEPYTALDSHGIELVEECITIHREHGGRVVMSSHQVVNVDVTQTIQMR